MESFNFLPQSCVKLKEAARKLLDKTYTQREADKIADMLSKMAPRVPEKTERDKFFCFRPRWSLRRALYCWIVGRVRNWTLL